MQAHSRWLHECNKKRCNHRKRKRGVKKILKYAIIFASTQLRITRLRKYRVGSHMVFVRIHCTYVRIHCTDFLIECW